MAKRRPSNLFAPNPFEERIRRLEDDLFLARTAIIDLMPEPAQKVLDSYYGAENAWAWSREASEKVVSLCEDVIPSVYDGYDSPRAKCPLCKSGPATPYHEGFALPEGLIRHLLGTHNSRACPVFDAARALSRDYFKRREERPNSLPNWSQLERRDSE